MNTQVDSGASANKPRVFLAVPVPDDLLPQIEAVCEPVKPQSGRIPTKEEMAEVLPTVEGVMGTVRSQFTRELLDSCPNLRVISNFGVGFDNIDVPAASERGVLVCNTPRVLDGAVADLTIAMLLCSARDVLPGDQYVRSGEWKKSGPPPLAMEVRGKTLGLIGMGRIGEVVARTAKAFNLRVVYYKPTRAAGLEQEGLVEYLERDEVFAQSDFISVHTALNDETRKSIGAREFGLMKPTATFINTSRGGVVDEAALIDALQRKAIRGAALDVMENEPLDPDSPLCSMSNVLLQPHVGSATVETRRAMMELTVRNLVAAMKGEVPEAMVNPDVRERATAGVGKG